MSGSFQLVRYYGWYSNSRAAGETGRPKGGNGAKRSGNMRGQRDKQALEAAQAASNAIQIIDVSEHKPRRIPSASRPKGDGLPAGQQRSVAEWQMARVDQVEDPGPKASGKVWEADPLMCPRCAHEMRIVSLIDDRAVIDLPAMLRIALQAGQILRHLGLWEEGVRVHTGADPPPSTVIEPWLDDPFPDYDTEPVLFANG